MSKAVSIIVPVYGDWPSLKNCIESLQTHVDTAKHNVMLVNDCGPEADAIEDSIKALIRNMPGYRYYRNKRNLGFLQNCNNAVNVLDTSNNDILLLNSDTRVTSGFLEELMAVRDISPTYAALSPRSNNASITTVPLSTATQKGIGSKGSYRVYQRIRYRLPRYYEAPVAHGFCMLIRREVIKKYGLFDEIFGAGYGEEVDFCQRIAKHGYKSLIANHAYVFHEEARSFSHETKAKLLEKNHQIIWSRYPEYRQTVRDYMDEKIPFETNIETQSGVGNYLSKKTRLKNIAKRNKRVSLLMNKVSSRLKR